MEAKKLSADLHSPDFAKQAVRYAWNKAATWAVLTDFENLKVFNAQDVKRSLGDRQLFDIPYTDYLSRFAELRLLSKEAIIARELDAYAERVGKKYQKVPVTETLSEDLNKCRELLTKALKDCNPSVAPDDLDEGVQKLLDRLVFLRVAEDRKVEENILQQLLRESELAGKGETATLYERMSARFRNLDEIYNSNLFSPHPFETWEEYAGATKQVIEKLYGKPGYYDYDFKAMSADVLGTVYEHYLAHRLSKSRKGVTLAEDARKRKEQGIYYTPSFVVDYIVRRALQPVLDRCQTMAELMRVRVLDPACGSGSFLIKALEVLYERYCAVGAALGTHTKLQIITLNLFGVDLDEKAVEITRLNLLVNSLDSRVHFPYLAQNIQCGNSLVSGTDEDLRKRFGKDYRDRKPFDWRERFPAANAAGGFDVIIGNPPYIKEYENKGAFDGLHESPYYQGKMDIWTMFASVGIDLLKPGGTLSFIAPNSWVTNAGASKFRDKMLAETEIRDYVDFGDYKVFADAGIQTMIFVLEKKSPRAAYEVSFARISDSAMPDDEVVREMRNSRPVPFEPEKYRGGTIAFLDSGSGNLLDKIASKRNFEFEDKEIAQGIVGAPDECFLVNDISEFGAGERKYLKPYFTSCGRYNLGESSAHIFYLSAKNFEFGQIDKYPKINKHFLPYKKVLEEAKIKYKTPEKPYLFLHRERDERFFSAGSKIVCGIRVARPSFCYTEEEYYGSRALNFIKSNRVNLKYLTGLLNSKLVFYWLRKRGKQLGNLLQVDKGPLLGIPIFLPSEAEQKKVAGLVDEMLDLNRKLRPLAENSDAWHRMKSEIERTDRKIDEAIYKLYELTDEEVATINPIEVRLR